MLSTSIVPGTSSQGMVDTSTVTVKTETDVQSTCVSHNDNEYSTTSMSTTEYTSANTDQPTWKTESIGETSKKPIPPVKTTSATDTETSTNVQTHVYTSDSPPKVTTHEQTDESVTTSVTYFETTLTTNQTGYTTIGHEKEKKKYQLLVIILIPFLIICLLFCTICVILMWVKQRKIRLARDELITLQFAEFGTEV